MKLLLDPDLWTIGGFALAGCCLYSIEPAFAGVFAGIVIMLAGYLRSVT